MNALFFLAPLAAVILLMLPLVSVYRGTVTKKKAKHAVLFNLCGFFGVCLISVLLPVGGLASAADAAAAASADAGMAYLGAALVTGLSCIGAGIAVAAAAPAAIGAFSENPKSFGKALIFVALGEGVALYGLIIALVLLFVA